MKSTPCLHFEAFLLESLADTCSFFTLDIHERQRLNAYYVPGSVPISLLGLPDLWLTEVCEIYSIIPFHMKDEETGIHD